MMRFVLIIGIGLVTISTAFSQKKGLVLRGMRIIDGTGKPAIENGVIVLKNGLIEAVGDSSLYVQPKMPVVNLKGKTIMPGMIDMHAHFWSNGRQQFKPYSNLYLAAGVTTVFSLGEYFPDSLDAFRQAINKGRSIGPRIYSAALYVQSGQANALMKAVNSADSVRQLINQYKRYLNGIKFYDSVSEKVFLAGMEEAKKLDLITTGHLNSIRTEFAIDHGINGLEHGIWTMPELNPKTPGMSPYCQIAEINLNNPLLDTIISKIVRNKVYMTATFTAMEVMSTKFQYFSPEWKIYLKDASRESYRTFKSRNQACLDTILVLQQRFFKRLYDRGGLIVTGTDPVFPEGMAGFGVHRELKRLVEAGIPELQALCMATLNGAIALRKEQQLGSIEKGKVADLVVIAGKPDKNIDDISHVVEVFKAGKSYDPFVLKKQTVGTIQFRN